MKRWFAGEAFAVVRVRNFRLYLFYRVFMTMAALMQSVIVGWQIYDLTHNVLWLGFIGLVEVIPQVTVSLFAGHFSDIWNRHKIIKYSSLLLILGAVILLIYSIDSDYFSTRFGIFPLFVSVFLTGLSRGILSPAQVAMVGQLVPRNLYANAATWNSANWHLAAVLGPATGGIVYGFLGIIPAYSLVLALYSISFFLMLLIKIGKHEVTETDDGIFIRIRSGIDFVFRTPELLGAFALDMFAVLFGGAVALLPVFASDVLFVGPQGLGHRREAADIGEQHRRHVFAMRR